jgi:endo-1,4-beta-xylanase
LPDWVSRISDKAELMSVVENHIARVVGQWKDKIWAWDVVNEISNDNGGFRDSVFHRVFVEDFVSTAFRAARKADPDAHLYINEYNLDNADWEKLKKACAMSIDGRPRVSPSMV